MSSEHLDTNKLFIDALSSEVPDIKNLTVVSPDIGGVKRAERFRQAWGRRLGQVPALAFVEKARAKGVLTHGRLIGDVGAGTAVILDDMIGTGSTVTHAARACKDGGAKTVIACAAHGLFTGNASDNLADAALDRVLVTDSVPPFRLEPALVKSKLELVSVMPLPSPPMMRKALPVYCPQTSTEPEEIGAL